jgi:hypothetical protein
VLEERTRQEPEHTPEALEPNKGKGPSQDTSLGIQVRAEGMANMGHLQFLRDCNSCPPAENKDSSDSFNDNTLSSLASTPQ